MFWVDPEPYTSPFEREAFTGNEIFDSSDAAAFRWRANLDLTEVEPELPRACLRQ